MPERFRFFLFSYKIRGGRGRTVWAKRRPGPVISFSISGRGHAEFKNNCSTEMCSGSEKGSYLRLIDFCTTELSAWDYWRIRRLRGERCGRRDSPGRSWASRSLGLRGLWGFNLKAKAIICPGLSYICQVRSTAGSNVALMRRFFFFFIPLKPRVEWYKSLWALNTSPPRNRCTFLWSSCSWIENYEPSQHLRWTINRCDGQIMYIYIYI